MAVRLFEGKDHASSYLKYRVSPSEELLNKVLMFLKRNSDFQCELAVDVGCGSGQGTVLLAPHFTQVVGTDISLAQLELAKKHKTGPNISYRECPAEELPFEDGSVDLVTAMSSFHWFDHSRFLQEVDRILKPSGCLVFLNYSLDLELSYGDCSEELNPICKEFHATLRANQHPYLGAGSFVLYEQTYKSLQYPVKQWEPSFWVRQRVPLSRYIGLMESFSSYQTLLQKNPEEAHRLSQDITQRNDPAVVPTDSDLKRNKPTTSCKVLNIRRSMTEGNEGYPILTVAKIQTCWLQKEHLVLYCPVLQ